MALVTQFVYLVLFLLLVVKLFPVLRQYLRIRKTIRRIPGPFDIPLIGNFLSFAGPIEDVYQKFIAVWEKYGSIFKLRIGHMYFVALSDPDDLEVIFTSPYTQSKISLCYDPFVPLIGKGLITLSGEDYRRHRKAITASLHLEILKDFVHMFAVNAERLSRGLKKFADSGEVFNAKPYVGDCANLNVCETLLSTDVTGMEAERDAYMSVVCKGSQMIFWKGMRPWYSFDPLFKIMSPAKYKEFTGVAKTFQDYVSKVLDVKWQQAKEGKLKHSERERDTFLESFLRSEESSTLSKEELRDEVKVLMFAGSDTTVQHLCFFLVAMALHRDVQEKVHKEIDSIFGSDRTRSVDVADLSKMKYLECALKEVLRLFPVAPFMGREVHADVVLPSGHTIPKGCNIIMIPKVIHRNTRWFPDPLKYDPDRFLPENTRGRHPFAYVPFSAGTRSCIGQKYGMMFVKTVAATLMRDYTALPDPQGPNALRNIQLTAGITMCATHGSNIRLQHRK